VELLSIGTATGVGVGAVQAVFNYIAGNQIQVAQVLGLNGVMFFYYLFGYSLRHSHIWISYGPIFSRLFISPAQHQIHHSRARKHWDKNLGGAFALWDWIFGTLYVPKEREQLEFGLAAEDQEQYVTVVQLYTRPFTNNARSLGGMVTVISILAIVLFFAAKKIMY
jgi:hypothetical protein